MGCSELVPSAAAQNAVGNCCSANRPPWGPHSRMNRETTLASSEYSRREVAHKWLASAATAIPVAACLAIVIAKFLLIWRININWDEFYFLSHVHAMVRGELSRTFQMAHTYLFQWLPLLGNDEIQQILAARLVMFALLVLTAVLVWKLTFQWVSPRVAAFAPLCYLAASPVLRHGASFRADSLLAPLTLGALLLLTARPVRHQTDCLAGLCVGIAVAVSVKTVLMGPLFLAVVLLGQTRAADMSMQQRLKGIFVQLARFGVVAAAIAGLLILILWIVMPAAPTETVGEFVAQVSRKTLLDSTLVPQFASLRATLGADWPVWWLLGGGWLVALVRRNFLVAACGLSLLPLLFYRNSFAYYYIVMLAPAAVLTAEFLDGIMQTLRGRVGETALNLVPVGLISIITLSAAVNLRPLVNDDIARQRSVVAAVHEIFPTAVPYIDHSGMIGSFPKVNFFMSSWGIENYRAGGKPFMRDAINQHRPPLLLANRTILEPGHRDFLALLPADRKLISESYIQYWGPIYVAGAHASLGAGKAATVSMPFPGRYRLEAKCPVLIDEIRRMPGDIITITDHHPLSLRAESCVPVEHDVRLIWSGAGPRPPRDPPTRGLYIGLF